MRISGRRYLRRTHKFPLLLLCCVSLILLSSCGHKTVPLEGPHEKQPVFRHVKPREAYSLIQTHRQSGMLVIIDVRPHDEFEKKHIEGAINIDYYSHDFRKDFEALDRDRVYLVYCRTGRRSREALSMMKQMSFRAVYHISGGIERWLAEDLPLVP